MGSDHGFNYSSQAVKCARHKVVVDHIHPNIINTVL